MYLEQRGLCKELGTAGAYSILNKIHLRRRTKQACFPAALAQLGQVLPVKFCSQLLWWEKFKYQQAMAGNTESQNGNLDVCTRSATWYLLKGFALSYPYREPKSGILKKWAILTLHALTYFMCEAHVTAQPYLPQEQVTLKIRCEFAVHQLFHGNCPCRLFLGIRSQITYFRVTRCFYGTATWT